mmetsp:Transcript_42437/g.99639  ORF Transcript_42437/g.99639 Transcript_42437/m.99639 type:complete len:309 (-) Transcript_42437:1313-2239(-)
MSTPRLPEHSHYNKLLQKLRAQIISSVTSTTATKDARRDFLVTYCATEKEAWSTLDDIHERLNKVNDRDGPELKARLYREKAEAESRLSRAEADTVDAARRLLGERNFDRRCRDESELFDRVDDSTLVSYAVLAASSSADPSWGRLSDRRNALLTKLLSDPLLMRHMLLAGGATNGRYPEAMEIYSRIKNVMSYETALSTATIRQSPFYRNDSVLHRMALAISLEFAAPGRPIAEFGSEGQIHIDPVRRYQHYERAYLSGELDPNFDRLTTWELRHVIDSDGPDDQISWCRRMLRNYRPDHLLKPDSK